MCSAKTKYFEKLNSETLEYYQRTMINNRIYIKIIKVYIDIH